MLAGPVAGVALYALTHGISMERIIEATGLTREDLAQLDARLPHKHMPALWRLLAESFPEEAVGLEVARSIPFSFFGLLLHAGRYATDLRAALEMWVRYRAIFSSSVRAKLVVAGEESRLEVSHPQDGESGGYGGDLALGVLVRCLDEIFGARGSLLRVELSHPPLGPRRAYERFFEVPLVFEADHHALVFRSADLSRPLPERDLPTLRYLLAHLELVRERTLAAEADPELASIHAAILENARGGEYGLPALARRLATTPRSLQRRLRACGTTPRALIDQVRAANARQLLSDPRLSLEEIAFLLGYSNEGALRRAFRRWTGESLHQRR